MQVGLSREAPMSCGALLKLPLGGAVLTRHSVCCPQNDLKNKRKLKCRTRRTSSLRVGQTCVPGFLRFPLMSPAPRERSLFSDVCEKEQLVTTFLFKPECSNRSLPVLPASYVEAKQDG